MEAAERAFLTVYLSGPDALAALGPRVEEVRRVLADDPDELEHFERSLEALRAWLDDNPFQDAGMVIFACWALDLVPGFHLAVAPKDRLWLGSSPFIKPLAELQDRSETFAVVAADNRATRIFLVSSAMVADEERVRGDVKNGVKKGGWSQKRYARRRQNELQHYATEVAEVLGRLAEDAAFSTSCCSATRRPWRRSATPCRSASPSACSNRAASISTAARRRCWSRPSMSTSAASATTNGSWGPRPGGGAGPRLRRPRRSPRS